MNIKLAIIFIAANSLFISNSWGGPHRSQQARHAFVKANACPATGKHRLPCPGYVIDHKQGLCVGGADSPHNMAWMTVEAAKAKDRWECKPGWETKLSQCNTINGQLECGK